MKELADVVEALIGTVGLNCGMQAAHEFLIYIQILKNDFVDLDKKMDEVRTQQPGDYIFMSSNEI